MGRAMTECNAALFATAAIAAATDTTAGVLRGVYIEPHPDGGVTITATNRAALVSIYDASGRTSKPALILPHAVPLAPIKRAERGYARRVVPLSSSRRSRWRLEIDHKGQHSTFIEISPDGRREPLQVQHGVIMPNAYADWRRVLPQPSPLYPEHKLAAVRAQAAILEQGVKRHLAPAADSGEIVCAPGNAPDVPLSSHMLTLIGDIGSTLAMATGRGYGNSLATLIKTTAPDQAALVVWPTVPEAFALAMPVVRPAKAAEWRAELPEWLIRSAER